jgi:hypothetical protein
MLLACQLLEEEVYHLHCLQLIALACSTSAICISILFPTNALFAVNSRRQY